MKRSRFSLMLAVVAMLAVMGVGASEVPRPVQQAPAKASAGKDGPSQPAQGAAPVADADAGAEAKSQPAQEATTRAQGGNRGYVVGNGGTARLHAGGPATTDQEEAAQETATPKAQGNNRGYVVGSGGVARLRDGGPAATDQSGATQAGTAPIGVNEPGVNRKAKGENDPENDSGLGLGSKPKSEGGD